MVRQPVIRLFVYGSLRRGGQYHEVLTKAEARFETHTQTLPLYQLVNLGSYPALSWGGQTSVVGEVYLIPQSKLWIVDELEDYPEEYIRRTIELIDHSKALTYLMSPQMISGYPSIQSGDWMRP